MSRVHLELFQISDDDQDEKKGRCRIRVNQNFKGRIVAVEYLQNVVSKSAYCFLVHESLDSPHEIEWYRFLLRHCLCMGPIRDVARVPKSLGGRALAV